MTASTVTALPPAVVRVGGALANVFEESEAYIGKDVSMRSKISAARIVGSNSDELNNDDAAPKVVELVDLYGSTSTRSMIKLIDGLGINTVHLAAVYLYDDGEQGGTVKSSYPDSVREKRRAGLSFLEKTADLIVDLTEITGHEYEGTEALADLINQLGGLDCVLDMGRTTLARAIQSEIIGLVGLSDEVIDDEGQLLAGGGYGH